MNNSLFSLSGKVAVVTGARRGIGKAIALAMAEAGADLAIGDMIVDDGALHSVAEEIEKLGRRCIAKQVDVTRMREVEEFIAAAASGLGTVDILANNVGISSPSGLLDTTEEEWQNVLDVNLKSALLCSQAASKIMMEKKKGAIVNTASCTGIRAFGSRNTYNISKAGVIMLTKILARELGQFGIRVNAVAPTMVKTDMIDAFLSKPELVAAEERRIPLRRLAEPVDIAAPAVFLASDAASYITGDILVIDGGQMA